nr:hypothetical protein [Tanacetum cinerariifolium]
MNRLKIDNLTQEIVVGIAFNLLKGTFKIFAELEYHFKECYKAVNDRLDCHNLEGREYPFDLSSKSKESRTSGSSKGIETQHQSSGKSTETEEPLFETADTEMQYDQGNELALSLIPGIVYNYLASKLKEEENVAIQLQSNKLREEAQAENQEFLNQVDSTMKALIKEQVKAQVSKIMRQIKKYVTESLVAEVLVRSTNQPQTSYVVAASLSEFELKKILTDKMENNESINRSDIQRNLYKALVELYNTEKDILSTYNDVVTLKIGRDDQDKDEDPSAGSDQGTKKRKSRNDAGPFKGSKSKESRTSGSSKGIETQHQSSGKSTETEEPLFETADTEMQYDQGNELGHPDDQPNDETAPRNDWFQKPDKPLTPDHA